MNNWSFEVYEEGYIIFRGSVPIIDFQSLAQQYCSDDWKVDMDWAQEINATFVIHKPEISWENMKYAVNQ